MNAQLLKEIFNKNKKSVSITGTIIKKNGVRQYLVSTQIGKIPCDANNDSYKVSDEVYIKDSTIIGYSGKRGKPTEILV